MKSNRNRRQFLQTAAVLSLSPVPKHVHSQIPDESNTLISSPSYGAKIKISLNAWSYYVPLYENMKDENKGMSLFDLLEECARLDFDAVDW